MKFMMASLTLLGLVAGGRAALASDMAGIYGRIELVAYDAGDFSDAVKISGTFTIAMGTQGTGGNYTEPRKGYFYYVCPSGQEDKCKAEWADLASIAKTNQCVAFGERYQNLGVFRLAKEVPKGPDLYPVAGGVQKVSDLNHQCRAIPKFR